MEYIELIRSAGLTRYESSAYVTLLENGPSTAREISGLGGVPMGKIYEVMSGLEEKGFIDVQKGRPILYRPIRSSVAFGRYFELKRKRSESELDRLKETIAVINASFPRRIDPLRRERVFVSTVMGKEEILDGYTEAFGEAERSIFIISSRKMMDPERSGYHETVVPLLGELLRRVERGIRLHCIDPGTGLKEIVDGKLLSIGEENLRDAVRERIEIRVVDSEYDFCLVDDTLSIIDVADPLTGSIMAIMKIYDSTFNRRLKERFLDVWNG
ncbi:MAG: hypothetical protein DRN57_02890 [Thermoplasmata archaeon]|nr:MAG: hypothetical protein DRN57_02890 [Thermoplasmata archaeon]